MTIEEAIAYGEDYLKDLISACCHIEEKHKDFVRMAIQALESQPRFLVHSDGRIEQIIEPCDDCVSRQSVNDLYDRYHPTLANHVYEFGEELKALPSVLPKREQGEWCEQNDDYFDWYECSECGYGSEGEMQYSSEHDVRTKYCPNCGAEMR